MPQSQAILPMLAFPFVFAGAWLAISLMLSVMSGWLGLVRRYPNRPEPALRTQHMLSGTMGVGVRLNNVLRLSVCQSGLRVGLLFLFAAFSRDFLVPWSEIRITRLGGGWFKSARLEFGPTSGSYLTIPARTADVLAEAAGPLWPEARAAAPTREPTVT